MLAHSGSGGKLGAAALVVLVALASAIGWVEEKRWNRRRRLQK